MAEDKKFGGCCLMNSHGMSKKCLLRSTTFSDVSFFDSKVHLLNGTFLKTKSRTFYSMNCHIQVTDTRVSEIGGTPIAGWFISRENPSISMDDLGAPISGNPSDIWSMVIPSGIPYAGCYETPMS